MPKQSRTERLKIAKQRVGNILKSRIVANLRTLEQKIADAGPYNQRIQPHILTEAKNHLINEGQIIQQTFDNAQWLHLADAPPSLVLPRLAELRGIWTRFTHPALTRRTGQALEITLYRALLASPSINTINGFIDLDSHDDSTLYRKHEVHLLNGKTLGDRSLDFIAHVAGEFVGFEAKNIRSWLYPHDEDIRETLQKALTLNVIPILVARRIPYVTFRLLGTCGVLLHETYNQRLAIADKEVAELASNKNLLGYHDIRTGNTPDTRLLKFTSENLPNLVAEAKEKLKNYSDLLHDFAWGTMPLS